MISFIAFVALLVVGVIVLVFKVKKSREVDQRQEEAARSSLFALGSAIENVHDIAVRRANKSNMTPPPAANSWYPAKKGQGASP